MTLKGSDVFLCAVALVLREAVLRELLVQDAHLRVTLGLRHDRRRHHSGELLVGLLDEPHLGKLSGKDIVLVAVNYSYNISFDKTWC